MTNQEIDLSGKDLDLIWYLASAKTCSLEKSPGDNDNWIERSGGSLPNYICEVAKGIKKSGKSTSTAIAIAISRIKKWAAGADGVEADTRAKAVAALAQWTALKARHAAKQIIKASHEDGEQYIILSEVTSYSLDQVRSAWQERESSVRHLKGESSQSYPYTYVREVYVDFIIVEVENTHPIGFLKIPYTVSDDVITFGNPEQVKQQWISDDSAWTLDVRGTSLAVAGY